MSIGNFKVKHYIKKHDVGDITKKYFKVKKGIIVPTKNLFALIRERDNFSELTIVMNSVENKYTKHVVWHPHEASCGQGKTMPKQGLIPQATVKGHRTPCGLAEKACHIYHTISL